MLIRKSPSIASSEITPQSVYLNRRKFLAVGTGAILLGSSEAEGAKLPDLQKSPLSTTTEKVSDYKSVTTYNNFYEFGTQKEDPAHNAGNFQTRPWTLKVEGHCNKPRTYDIDTLAKLAPLEERIYRLRCVEAWSVVVPWAGFSLAEVLKQAQPTGAAKYVAFETYYDSKQMPLGKDAGIKLPYVEGLRIDEAMHPLTLLAVGMYGETLPNQNGAPVRLVVPWKYGFKSIKSIVRIRFVDKQPPTTWNITNAREYGFYSNVNPEIDHPRWSQATERRLGEFARRKTLMMNGYADQVASLYKGMDLKANY
jgi:methionine sulfoxide reductase catalytic subunit